VHITVTDKSGKVVRDMDGTKEVGVNRVTWDLKTRSLTALPRAGEPGGPEQTAASATAGGEVTEAATEAASEAGVPGGTAAAAAAAAGGGGFGAFNGAMRVDPGEYTVKVAVGKVELTKTVVVEEDPRIALTAEDRAARHQALDQLARLMTTSVATRRSITGMRTSLNTAIEGWKKTNATKPPENIEKAAEDLLKRTDDACRKFGTPQQCGEKANPLGTAGPPLVYMPPPITQRVQQLMGGIENYAAPPSATQLEQIKILQGLVTEQSAAARKLTQEDLASLNKMMNDAGVPFITIPRGGGTAAGGGS